MFQIDGFLKMWEEDVFADGCQPETAKHFHVDVKFTGKTAAEVIKKAQEYLGVDDEGTEKNACDEPGRVDFALTENDEGEALTPREVEAWKQGNIKAFYAVYSCIVEKVTPAKL